MCEYGFVEGKDYTPLIFEHPQYSSALEDNLFEVKEFVNEKTGFTSTQTLITPKGRETFRLLMIL